MTKKKITRLNRAQASSQAVGSPSGERIGLPVKTVYQTYATGNSGVSGQVPVTIAKAPWENEK